jgi:hypothetical protein
MRKLILIILSIGILFYPAIVSGENKSSEYDPFGLSENLEKEFGLSSGYTGNLLGDAAKVEDAITISKASLRYYPFSFMEMSFQNEYTYYNKTYNLSNYLGAFGISMIPTGPESPISVYLSGKFDFRHYPKNFRIFNNDNLDILASLGWQFSGRTSLRMGYRYNSNSYIHSDISSKKKYETFLGANCSFLGSNTIDFEIGYSIMDYSFISDTVWSIDTIYTDYKVSDYYIDGYLLSFYISPRYSRSIGPKSGISLNLNYHKFSNEDHSVILISEIDYISPFANVTEGRSAELSVKSYLVPGMIITTGTGYWHKTYLRILEGDLDFVPLLAAYKRIDEFSRWNLVIERPMIVGHSGILKPSLNIEYTNNSSNFNNFDYYRWSVTAGIIYIF